MPDTGALVPEKPVHLGTTQVATDKATGRVYARNAQTGEPVLLDPGEAEDAIATGQFIPLSHEEASKLGTVRELRKDISTPEAAALGVASGLTGGLATAPILRAAGPQFQQALEEEHPVATGLGEAAGTVAPFLIPGGEGLKLFTFPGAAEALGKLVPAGESALGKFAARTAGMGVEGAAWGGATAASEAIKADEPITWQKVAAGAGSGLALGALVAAPFAGVEGVAALRKPVAEAASDLAHGPMTEEKAAALGTSQFGDDLHPQTPGRVAKIIAAFTGSDPETAQKVLNDPAIRKFALEDEREAAREKIARSLHKDFDDVYKVLDVFREQRSNVLRNAEKLADSSKLVQQRQALADFIDGSEKSISDMKQGLGREAASHQVVDANGNVANVMDPVQATDWQRNAEKLDQFQAILNGARKADTSAEIAKQFDRLRQEIAARANPGRPLIGDVDKVAAFFRSKYQEVHDLVRNPEIWGEPFAKMQADVTDPVHRMLSARQFVSGKWLETKPHPDPIEPWFNATGPSLPKFFDYTKELVKPGYDEHRQALRAFVTDAQQSAEGMLKHYDVTASQRAQLQKTIDKAQVFLDAEDKAAKQLSEINQVERLVHGGDRGAGRALPVIGAVMGGVPGMVAGEALRAGFHPGGAIKQWASWDRLLGKTEARTESAVRHFFSMPKLGGAVSGSLKDSARATKSAIFAFGTKGQTDEKKLDALAEKLAEAKANPERVRQNVQAMMGGPDTPKSYVDGLTSVVQAQLAALEKVLPDTRPLKTLTGEQLPLTREQMRDLMDAARVILDPPALAEQMAAGTLTPAEVQILQQVMPEYVTDLKTRIMNGLAERGDKPLPRDKATVITALFGIPADITLTPEYIGRMQMIHQARYQSQGRSSQKTPPRRTGGETGLNHYADDILTPTDHLEKGYNR